ncbi:MAG: hypothetical protein KDE62_03435, partial [Calditrichaeota bacterium]|nr:hypothetical protein [Calditrichota bacterium]
FRGNEEDGLIEVDENLRTTVAEIYAAGDNSAMKRTVSFAVAAGTRCGMAINLELIMEAMDNA